MNTPATPDTSPAPQADEARTRKRKRVITGAIAFGALALAPIFLLWIYLGWSSILFGASFASSMSAFRYQPVALRLPLGFELYGLLRMLGRFRQARAQGRGLHSDEIQQLEPILTDALVQDMLGIAPEQRSPIQKLMRRFINVINRVQQGIDAMRFGSGSDNDSQSPGL